MAQLIQLQDLIFFVLSFRSSLMVVLKFWLIFSLSGFVSVGAICALAPKPFR